MEVFHKKEDYEHYLKIIHKYQQKFTFFLYHFVLMPNHVHLLFKSPSDISKLMHSINLSYAQYYKKNYQHIGHFWQDRFKSYIVEDDAYLITVGKYIELNALRAGLVKSPEEYKYSSYNFYAYGKGYGVILTPDPWFLNLSEDPIIRRQRYRESILADIVEPKIVKSQFIGSEDFILSLMKEKFRKRIKRNRGRPRKKSNKLMYNFLCNNKI